MSDRIAASLRQLFEENRIVFWYDADRDMRAEFDAVSLPGVTKLEIANNEFGLKYRILQQEPKGKFLLFKDGQVVQQIVGVRPKEEIARIIENNL